MAFNPGYFSQPNTHGAKKDEIATLIIRGTYFSDWETVWIRDKWEDPNPDFRFTAAEREQEQPDWKKLQFRPRDEVEIWLANIPMVTSSKAVSGVILVRQVGYDANNHGISLQGVGISWYAARASIVPSIDGTTFNGSLKEITEKLLAPTGVKLQTVGDIPGKPFENVQSNPGESRFSFIERLSRMRNVMIGSTSDGDWLLIGLHQPAISGDLIEGFNILSAQIVFTDISARDMFYAGAQKPATDQSNMGSAAQQEQKVPGSLGRFSPLYVPVEQPVKDLDEVAMRAVHEQMWNEGDDIQATILVNGWFNPKTGNIWKAGQVYMVDSPMGPLFRPLGARSVTYTQDRQGGTKTSLDLVPPWRLKMTGYGQASQAVKDEPNDKPDPTKQEAQDNQFTHSGITFPE